MTLPVILAIFLLALLVIVHDRYGYFRDELYYIACTDHLSWGYVDLPPLSIGILWVVRHLLGDSLQAIRFLPSVAVAVVVLLTGLMARRLGGGRLAQGLAALSAVAAHGLIGHGTLFTMNPFDLLFWTLAGYVSIVILKENRPKLWILFGVLAGLGLLNKYSMGFLCVGLFGGLLLTPERKHFATRWFWLGILATVIIVLPHVLWQIAYGFPSLEFMRNASQYKNVSLGVVDFLFGQIKTMNFLNAPIWIGGIYFFFVNRDRHLRSLGYVYPIVFVVMILSNAKLYYLSVIYPLFLAGGAVQAEIFFHRVRWTWMQPVYTSLLVLLTLVVLPLPVPILPVDAFIRYEKFLGQTPHADEHSSLNELPQYYADQFGWEDMVAIFDTAYRRLTPQEQAECVLYVRNYGEAGAIDFFGKKYGLPGALCPHNSYWLWGPGERTGNIAVILGGAPDREANFRDLRGRYRYVEYVDSTHSRYAMPFEIGRQIFICKGMNTTFQKLWPGERFYY